MCAAAISSEPVDREATLRPRRRQAGANPGFWAGLTGGAPHRLTHAYKEHPWVFATLNSRKRHITSAPFVVGKTASDGSTLQVDQGDGETAMKLASLFERPNRSMSGKQMLAFTQLWMDLLGECFWVLGRKNVAQVPDFMMPWPGGSIWKPHAMGPDDIPVSWMLTKPNGSRVLLSADQVVHHHTENPYDMTRGCPPLAAGTITLNADVEADEHMLAKFVNGVEASGFLSFAGEVDEDQYADMRKQMEDKHRGARKAHKMMILEDGATFIPNTQTNKDLEYLGLRQWNKDVVLGLFNWPETALGKTTDQTFSNAAQANRDLWGGNIIPIQDDLAATIDTQLLRHIEGGKYTAFWDRSKVDALRMVEESKWDTVLKMKEAGTTLREANRKMDLDLERQPGDDVVLVPNTQAPIEAVAAGATLMQPAAPAAPGPTPEPKTAELDAAMQAELARDDLATEQARSLHLSAIDALETKAKRKRAQGAAARWNQWWQQVLRPSERVYVTPLRNYMLALSNEIMRSFNRVARETRVAPGLPMTEAKVTTSDVEAIIFDRAEWDARLRSISREAFNAAAEFSSAFTTEALSSLVGPQVVGIDLNAAPVQRFINARTQLVTGINDRIAGQLATQLREGIANGESIRELRVRIANISGRLSDPARTLRIARTEQGTIASTIKFEEASAALDMGRWLSAGDEDVRNTHFVAEFSSFDRPVLLGRELFTNGLRHPLDSTAPASEIVNCRCDLDMVPPDEADAHLANRAVPMTADELRLAFYGGMELAAGKLEEYVRSGQGEAYLDTLLGWDAENLQTTCAHSARSDR